MRSPRTNTEGKQQSRRPTRIYQEIVVTVLCMFAHALKLTRRFTLSFLVYVKLCYRIASSPPGAALSVEPRPSVT